MMSGPRGSGTGAAGVSGEACTTSGCRLFVEVVDGGVATSFESGRVARSPGQSFGAMPAVPPPCAFDFGRAVAGHSLGATPAVPPCAFGFGRAVAGQSFGATPAVPPPCAFGFAVAGESADAAPVVPPRDVLGAAGADPGQSRSVLAGRVADGATADRSGAGCVATGRAGAGFGLGAAASLARASLAAALFGSKRGGSVCLLT
jgi:hypothetical protein